MTIESMRILRIRPAILVVIIISTALYGISNITAAHGAAPLNGSFTINPQFILAGGNDSFTATASGGSSPYKFNWTFGDSPLVANGSFVTHIFSVREISGDSATLDVTALQTRADGDETSSNPSGCLNWSGSYTMKKQSGRWLISRAQISPAPC